MRRPDRGAVADSDAGAAGPRSHWGCQFSWRHVGTPWVAAELIIRNEKKWSSIE
jgi:hypothetical protein